MAMPQHALSISLRTAGVSLQDKIQHSALSSIRIYLLKVFPMARTVQCIKLGKEAEGLDFPPYPGDLGKRIWEGVSKEAWAAWLKHQTMLVNENRLNLADARARQYLARQMENHFFGDGADAAQGYVPPTA